ncbi:EbsA family protein [Vagococcus zengguangii]|uniref:EbsA protein n=2 Tax=Vagococcus zengguangii TaxID=2571750 RepID=A0A4D7CTX9_9ENTE|nr:EbsA family protein [Vagococcus zengguangii]QCI86412.1 hypothetical protein FA707_05280 [Vagococcus zengguangii]
MNKDKQLTKFYYQPDIAHTVIYWSLSLCLFLGGIIITLEKIKFSWMAVMFILLGLLLILIGSSRRLCINDQEITFSVGLPIFQKNKRVPIKKIHKISLGSKGFTLYQETPDGEFNEIICLMKEKSLQYFVQTMTANEAFNGEISGLNINELIE